MSSNSHLSQEVLKIVVIFCGTAETSLDFAYWAVIVKVCSHSTEKYIFRTRD